MNQIELVIIMVVSVALNVGRSATKDVEITPDEVLNESCEAVFDWLERRDEGAEAEKLWEGRRIDMNDDGMPDLIQEMDPNGLGISSISRIYAYADGTVREVFSDLNDMSEYYFIGADEKLIYDYTDFGEMDYGSYSVFQFDVNWDRERVDQIEIYYFYDHIKDYEEEHEWFSEAYPDTYGARGSGYYYFHSRPKTAEELGDSVTDGQKDSAWVREEISRREFVSRYKVMTGWDFFAVNTDFP